MKKVLAFIRIIRPINFLITFFSIFVAGLICTSGNNDFLWMILAGFSGSFVGSAGNVINDILDIEIDRINRPDRVLPSGVLTRSSALLYYVILNITAIAIAIKINFSSLIIVICSIIIVFFYSYSLKKIPLIGNIVVAFMTALAFLFGGAAVGNIRSAVIPAVFAFLINLIREIIKDIEDLEGDMKNDVISFPARYGNKAARILIFILTITLVLFTFIPFLFNIFRIEYFMIVMFTVNLGLLSFLTRITGEMTRSLMGRESFLLKIYMIFGLIAIYFGN